MSANKNREDTLCCDWSHVTLLDVLNKANNTDPKSIFSDVICEITVDFSTYSSSSTICCGLYS